MPRKPQLPVAPAGLENTVSEPLRVDLGLPPRPTLPSLVIVEADAPEAQSASRLCDFEQVHSPL